MEKLVIKKYRNMIDECYKTLKVTPKLHEQVKKIADKTNRQINDIATILVEYALENAEIEEDED